MRLLRLFVVTLLCVAGVVSGGSAESGLDQPTLLLGYTNASGQIGETTEVPLYTEPNGAWTWVTVPSYITLNDMSLAYQPAPFGFLQLVPTYDPFGSPSEPVIDVNHIDFTQSESQPYAYRILQPVSGEVLRSGWITVSHNPKPQNLPSVPSPDMPLPTFVPQPEPTFVPEPGPTNVPQPMPTQTVAPLPTYTPMQTGYGLVTYATGLRELPGGATVRSVPVGTVVFVDGQYNGQDGLAWHRVTVQSTGETGYILSNYVRFMTQQEINDYLYPPTPLPTLRPQPTAAPVRGYMRVTRETALRRGVGDNTASLSTLYAGDVVYAMDSAADAYGTRWLYVQSANRYGYIRASHATVMTQAEVTAYLDSLRYTPAPTARPTAAPTIDPAKQYAVVKMDDVNFRLSPGGSVIRRVNKGTLAQLLDEPIRQAGYTWYRVQIDKDIGYLRSDMLNILQVTPTATPLPTTPPLSLMERIRANTDTVRYTDYARKSTEAVSYAVADFDCDAQMELVLVIPYTRMDGTNAVRLDAYKWTDNAMKRVARRDIAPVLTANTRLNVNLVTQDGRTVIYVTQGSNSSASPSGGQALTLIDTGWLTVGIRQNAPVLKEVMRATASAGGVVRYEDLSGLFALTETLP